MIICYKLYKYLILYIKYKIVTYMYITMPLRKIGYHYHKAWSVVDFCVLLIPFRTDIQ